MKSKFKINGLDCANCANELERAIQKLDGIKSANINFMAQKMELEYDEDIKEEIIIEVKKSYKKRRAKRNNRRSQQNCTHKEKRY